jgi:hypothetical protein
MPSVRNDHLRSWLGGATISAMTVLHPLLHAALSVERDREARAARHHAAGAPRAVRPLRRLPRRLRP